MRRLLIVPLVAAGVALTALPASAASAERAIATFPQGNSTFEQVDGGVVDLLGSYHNLAGGNYRTAVYQGAACGGARLVSRVFTRNADDTATVMQDNLGTFDLTTTHSVGLLRWGKLVSCNQHPAVIKGGPYQD